MPWQCILTLPLSPLSVTVNFASVMSSASQMAVLKIRRAQFVTEFTKARLCLLTECADLTVHRQPAIRLQLMP